MDNQRKLTFINKQTNSLLNISLEHSKTINRILDLVEKLIKQGNENEADIKLLYSKLKKKGVI